MRLYPFHGIHFGGADSGRLAAPPYDQIDDELRDRLHAEPHQFAHLSRPVADGDDSKYVHATRLHRDWLSQGILREDSEAALYPYEIQTTSGGRRLGLTAMLGIESPETRIIRPHEHTLAKAVADRLELLRAMEVDLEPILLLADDGGSIESLLREDIGSNDPFVVYEDADGNRHRLFRVTDRDRLGRYVAAVRDASGLIADGHHRYKVAGLFAEERGAAVGSAAAAKLTVVTSLESPELRIDPIHRGLRLPPDLTKIEDLAQAVDQWDGEDGLAFAKRIAEYSQPTIGIWPSDGTPQIWRFNPDRPLFDLPVAQRKLAVTLLHRGIFRALGIEEAADTDGTVVYKSDPEALVHALRKGQLAVGFFLPPMQPETFAEAVADGGILPPKSTRFLPKVASGMVWARHSAPIG